MAAGDGPDAGARFRPEGQHELGPSGQVSRITANIAAIRVLRRMQDQGRPAEPGEQAFLAKWSGWGAVPQIFDDASDKFADARAELRELLTEDEWAAARRTTINAHYTDAGIVRAIWDAVAALGFDGGVVLEPGCGSGNFIGFAPPSARMLGIELDPLTAQVAAALYPDAEVRNESFADSRLPEQGFDLVIGNVPFGNVILTDPRHNAGRRSIHNHFIVKSLAMTRPGGLAAVLTSRYTMDARDDAARREMAKMADLVTAVRLPSGAHRRAAGTEAVTDLMIFRRREEGRPPSGPAWEQAVAAEFDGGDAWVSGYFRDRPENVIGDLAVDGGQYSAAELIVRPRGELSGVPALLAERLAAETGKAHEARLAMSPAEPWRKMADIRAGGGRVSARIPSREAGRFEGTITAIGDGTFTILRDGDTRPFPCPASQAPELRALLRLRDAVSALLDAERATAEDTPRLGELRARLNREYDAYARVHGPLNRMSWRRTGRTDDAGNETWARQRPAQGGFRDDPFGPIVYALEEYDPETDTASKMAIFTQRVISPREPAASAESPADAITICMDADGEIRLGEVARLLGLPSEENARAAIGELAYDEPGTGLLVPAAEYLSGKVREKLEVADNAAAADPRFRVNAVALRRVLPPDLGPGEIDARLGASWIPPALVQQGLREILQDPGLTVKKGLGTTWSVEGSQETVLARQVYGTRDKDAVSLAQALLEQRPIKVSYSMDDLGDRDRARLRELRDSSAMSAFIRSRAAAATLTARAKADELSERFTDWLWSDPQRTRELTALYNRKFNSLVLRTYDDARPRLPGLASWFKPHPHQYAAVARIISEPAAMLAHEVGAGKTAEMTMGAMELRRLGLVNKPAIIVPNHMLEQFQREFLQLYPQAKVLACDKRDLEKDRRHAFVARIATGDWDAVIMSRSVFERIPMSAAEQDRYIRAKLAAYDAWLDKALDSTEDARMVKRMEKQRLSFEERLKRKLSRARDAGISWEQTGIDYLFIDEAHGYKNLDTRSNNPSLDIDGSGRASDLEMKLGYLRRGRGKRVCTFATATPIANSMTEAYVMTRLLRPDLLEAAGIEDFDGWVSSFATTVTDVEVAPEGGLRVKERVAKFRNLPELLLQWRVFTDVKTAEDLKLPIPALAGGKPEVVTTDRSDELRTFMLELASRAEAVRSGKVDPRDDNMLKISTDGRAAALDLRLAGRRPPDGGKLDVAADRIAAIYQDAKGNVYYDRDGKEEAVRGGLQIVFCELGTPTGKAAFGVYEYLRAEIAARGVPAAQVRFMHEARNDREKAELFAAARAGKVSVLIGTTELMGVGTNVQKRAVALHHLDCPWRPADVAQREGRILRQGNQNKQVEILRYVTEGSFDAYMWQTVLRKLKFILQIMRGKVDAREMEDIGGSEILSTSEVTALATGDMRILDKAKADAAVQELSGLEAAWRRGQRHLKESIAEGERRIPYLQQKLARLEEATGRRTGTRGDAFSCRLAGQPVTRRTDAAAIIQEAARRLLATAQQAWMGDDTEDGITATEPQYLGTLGGLGLEAAAYVNGYETSVELRIPDVPRQPVILTAEDIDADKPPIGVVTRLENMLDALDGDAAEQREEIEHTQAEIARARAALGTPFSKATQLAAARARADRLAAELGGQRVTETAEPEAHETPVADAQAARDGEDVAASTEPGTQPAPPTGQATWEPSEEVREQQQQEAGDQSAGPSGDGQAAAGATPAGGATPAAASSGAAAPQAEDGRQPGWPSLTDLARASDGRIQIIPIGFGARPATPRPGPDEATPEPAHPLAPAASKPAEERPVRHAEPAAGATAETETGGIEPPGTSEEAVDDASGVPEGTQPVPGHQGWGGTMRPERLLYPDGTALTVSGLGEDGGEWRRGTAAGSIAATEPEHGRGRLQVVRWDDGSYHIVHPALACATGIDPYRGLGDRDRARWQAFDRGEAEGNPVASMAAGLVDAGDTLQVERGPRSPVMDQRGVLSVREVTDGPVPGVEFAANGGSGVLRYPAAYLVGVYLHSAHPTLAATIAAVTGRDQAPAPGPQDAGRPASAVPAAAAPPASAGGRRPTEEQQAIIHACASGQNLVIEAGAGTGKTTTLRLASAAMGGRTGLYVAYNKAIADEARGSFPPNVTASTAHALAFQAIGKTYAHRLPPRSKRLPAQEIAGLLGIREPLQIGRDVSLAPPQLAGIVMSTVGSFCQSADPAIAGAHIPAVNGVTGFARLQLTQLVVPLAEAAWADLQRTDGRLPFTHDHYLKMWQLTGPSLNADFILFDEAQDANPVTAAIIQGQDGAQKIAVGDSCQAIYGWRGAVDALATWPADQRLYLSQSFRFGEPIADEANKWLDNLGAVLRLKGTPSIPSVIGPVPAPDAVLCRTNAEAVSQALTMLEQGRRVALVGGGDDIKRLAEAARELQDRGYTSHPELAAFKSWNAVQRYVRDDESGADLATFVRLVDTHGPATVIDTIDRLSSEDNADVTVSTAHKAKGREWDKVLIATDFREPTPGAAGTPGVIPRPDAMLAYVAVTRARKELDRKGLAWIDNYADAGAPAAEPSSAGTPGREQATLAAAPGRTEAELVSNATPPPASQAGSQPVQDGGIRIEHDAEGTRVHGTSKSQASVIKALKDQGFKWSRNQGYWYLNRTWHESTRSHRVRGLQAVLGDLGVLFEVAQDPRQPIGGAPEPEHRTAEPPAAAPAPAPSASAAYEDQPPGRLGAAGSPAAEQEPAGTREPERQAPAVPSTPAPAAAADEVPAVIRVDHNASQTRVFGTDDADAEVTSALTMQQFLQSADEGFWYLPEDWGRGVREQRAIRLLGQLQALGRPYERVGDSDLIRIEHTAAGTRVYGANNRYSDQTRAFRRLDFIWSEDQACWHLPPAWTYETRDNRVHFLRTSLEGLGRQYVQSDAAPQTEAIGPDAGNAATSFHASDGDPAAAPEPPGATGPANAQQPAAEPRDTAATAQSGTDKPQAAVSGEDSPDTAPSTPPDYEQASLFGTPAPPRRPARKEQPPATRQQEPQSARAAVPQEPAPTETGVTPPQAAVQPAPADATVTDALREQGDDARQQPADPGQPASAGAGVEDPDADGGSAGTHRALVADAAVASSLAGIPFDPRPYDGGRAQAVSGSKIIDADYRAWAVAHAQAGDARLPDEHPRARQFATAWRRVEAKGLDDGPGPAAARYHAVAHAALALAAAIDPAVNPRERAALDLIATHARKHSVRLRATGERAFTRTRQAGRYEDGRPQAEKGSRVVDQDYRAWIRTGSPLEAARDPQLWQHARRTEQAWQEVRRRGLVDGPAPAATRYRELADAAQKLADGFTATLPSSSLPSLLDLADHARRHSTRLLATAQANKGAGNGGTASQREVRGLQPTGDAYEALPDQMAAITRQAYASQHPRPPGSATPVSDPAAQDATARRQNYQPHHSRG
jgi:N12 class adenine-specific DNA methylase